MKTRSLGNIVQDPTKWGELDIRTKLVYSLAMAAFVVGWILTFTGFFINPMGVIDPSVLTALGIALTFAGSCLGISFHYSNELTKFETRILNDIHREHRHDEQME